MIRALSILLPAVIWINGEVAVRWVYVIGHHHTGVHEGKTVEALFFSKLLSDCRHKCFSEQCEQYKPHGNWSFHFWFGPLSKSDTGLIFLSMRPRSLSCHLPEFSILPHSRREARMFVVKSCPWHPEIICETCFCDVINCLMTPLHFMLKMKSVQWPSCLIARNSTLCVMSWDMSLSSLPTNEQIQIQHT